MNLGLDPKDTGQSCKGVKHKSARVRYVCVFVHCEQQSAHRRAFPLDKEMWTCRLCCRAGWWAAAGGLPRRSARSWKGGLVCPGAEWLEPEFSSPSAWFQFYFPQLSAAFPVPHCPGAAPLPVLIVSRRIFRGPQVGRQPRVAQPGRRRGLSPPLFSVLGQHRSTRQFNGSV